QTSVLGDIVLSTGALEVARKHFPNARQHIITTDVGRAALKDHPLLDSIHVFQKNRLGPLQAMRQLAEELRQVVPNKQSTVLLQPHRSFRSGFLSSVLGYPRIVYEATDFPFRPVARVPHLAVLHEAQRVALLPEPLGVSREETLSATPILPEAPLGQEPWASFFATNDPILCCAPGSVWGTKRWPPESYHELMKMVLRETSARIAFLGGAPERDVAGVVTEGLPEPGRWIDLAGKTSLDDLRRIYPRATALVSNDSSAIHYASAF